MKPQPIMFSSRLFQYMYTASSSRTDRKLYCMAQTAETCASYNLRER